MNNVVMIGPSLPPCASRGAFACSPVEATTMYRRILVPVSASDASDRAVLEAVRLARRDSAVLRFVHILDSALVVKETASFCGTIDEFLELLGSFDLDNRVLVEIARRQAARAGVACVSATHRCDSGDMSEIVVAQALAWRADVIVMGVGIDQRLRGAGALILRDSSVPVIEMLARPNLRAAAGI